MPTADAGRTVDPERVRYKPDAPRVVVGRDAAILWFDQWFAVLWKPAGMLAVPAPGRDETPNVLKAVGRHLGRALAVHRLDEETSGLMMVARTKAAQEAMKARLEAHAVERRYLAIVKGSFPAGPPREIRTTIVRDRGDGRRGSGPGGKPAVTWLALVEALPGASVVEARLETGRTHQVRIHLAELGHPVLGDTLYGDRRAHRLIPRLALHAAVLAFTHPFTNAPHRFQAPLADDLEIARRLMLAGRGAGRRG